MQNLIEEISNLNAWEIFSYIYVICVVIFLFSYQAGLFEKKKKDNE